MQAGAPMRVAGLILAGGEGRRMGGRDKALVDLAGRPLLAHVRDRFAPQVGPLAVSANGDPARLAGFGLPVLADETPGLGPLSGVLAGLDWARAAGADRLATVAVDTPFLPADLVARLAAAAGPGQVALAATARGPHPTCALWPVSAAPALAAALAGGRRSLRGAAGALGVIEVAFADEAAFVNLNTAEDLAAAAARIAAGGP